MYILTLFARCTLLGSQVRCLETRRVTDKLSTQIMASPSKKRALSVTSTPWEAEQARKRHRLPQTCEWIRQEPAYAAWKAWDESSSSVLWIQGPVGIGKSYLADYIASDVEEVNPKSTVLTTSCTAASTPTSIVHRLTAQLLQSEQTSDDLKGKAASVIENTSNTSPVPYDVSYLAWDGMTAIVEESQRLTLIIDGLDEVSDEFLSRQNFDLPSKLVELTTILAGNVRLLVLSRPQASILRALRDSPSIQVTAAKVAEDIKRFCLFEVGKHSLLSKDADTIARQVAQQSEGIFIWASLAIKVLAQQTTQEGVQNHLETLPISLEELYLEVFEQQSTHLDQTHIMLRDLILRWLVFSVRPMKATEVANAISTEANFFITDMEATAAETCGPLVKFEDGYMKPVHHSLRDFLCSEPRGSSHEKVVRPDEQNLRMAKALLEYLKHPQFQEIAHISDLKEFGKLHPVAEYATLYWVHHLSLARADDDLQDQIQSFFASTNARVWIDTLLSKFLTSSVLPIPPRPAMNARFFHISMLMSQIVNYFEQGKREEIKQHLDNWLESVYEGLFTELGAIGDLESAEYLLRWIELAEVYSWLPGKDDKASKNLREAIDSFSQSTNPECKHLIIAAQQALADDLKRNGNYAEAQKILEDLVKNTLENVSDEHPALPFAYDSLGWVLSRQGKLDDSAIHLRKALELCSKHFGSRSPYTLRTRLTLAEVLAKLGQNEEADALCSALESQLAEYTQERNPQAKDTISKDSIAHINILAGIYMQQGKYAQARNTFQMVVEDRKLKFGPDSRLTLWAEMQLGLATREAGDVEEAQAIFNTLLPRQSKVLGPDHQDVKDVTKMLQELQVP